MCLIRSDRVANVSPHPEYLHELTKKTAILSVSPQIVASFNKVGLNRQLKWPQILCQRLFGIEYPGVRAN